MTKTPPGRTSNCACRPPGSRTSGKSARSQGRHAALGARKRQSGTTSRWDLIVLIACEDISDHERGEQRLAAQSGVSRVLAESDSLAEASPELLRAICEAMDWDWGALWTVRQQPERLRASLSGTRRALTVSNRRGQPGIGLRRR